MPCRIGLASRIADDVRRVDHWRAAAVRDLCHRVENVAAQIGIADGVEDDVMRGQWFRQIEIFGIDSRHREDAIVEDHIRRNIAALRGNDEQNAQRSAGAPIGPGHDAVAGETLFAMPRGAFFVALLFQNIRQALMRVGQACVDDECVFVKPPRFVEIAVFQKDVSEIDEAERIVGMTFDGLAIGGDGGRAIACCERQARQDRSARRNAWGP